MAYLHPIWMLSGLALVGLTLRAGLVLRRGRLQGAPRDAGSLGRHLRLARPAVLWILLGFLGGPASSFWLRGWQPFEKFHGALGLLAALLFVSTGWLGLLLQRGRSRAVAIHGWLGLSALLAAAVAAAAGFVLLP